MEPNRAPHLRPRPGLLLLLLGLPLALPLALMGPAMAYEINDTLAANVLAAWGFQCQQVSGDPRAPDSCRGAAALQPAASYRPTDLDQVFLKFAFAAGDGLNPVPPFNLSPWYVDLTTDVHQVNGRSWSSIQEIWYARDIHLGEAGRLRLVGGIVDPTLYIDENAYANDAFTQFMNEALVNASTAFLVTHDWGGILVWTAGDWALSATGMNIGKNTDGNNFNFYAAQVRYRIETPAGEGNYRLLYAATSRAFLDPTGQDLQRRQALSLSCDQAVGPVLGIFLRLGWQAEDAAVDDQAAYSGGLDLRGAAWGREDDNIGLGFAHLAGGNAGVDGTDVFEAYYRLGLDAHLALTADLQYERDGYEAAPAAAGWIFGLRVVVTL